ncbi:MAG TPA: YeeE/YedE family protein [Pseudomonadales bacterium]|nr:YeeE/YedE family protein [Pseudomonadales bacterium]
MGANLKKNLSAFASGLLFGLGLAIAGMTDPAKVLAFLDVTGAWDASLVLVLGSAVGVSAIGFRILLKKSSPVFGSFFHLPEKIKIDSPLIIGSVLFGIGWGISGYCPGPAIALLASPNRETWLFLPAMLAGWFFHADVLTYRFRKR